LDKENRYNQQNKYKIQQQIDKINSNLDRLNTGAKTTNRIEAIVTITSPGKVRLNISYIVPGSKWEPVYDLRVDKKAKKMNITYHALIRQNTGENWDNVRLKLSTAQAQLSGQSLKLKPVYLGIRSPVNASSDSTALNLFSDGSLGYAMEKVPEVTRKERGR